MDLNILGKKSWKKKLPFKTKSLVVFLPVWFCFTDLRAMTLCLSFVPLYKAEMSKTGIDCAKAFSDEFQCKKTCSMARSEIDV